MWNCNAALAKNGLYNSTVSLTGINCRLQRCVALTSKKRLLQSYSLTIESHSDGKKIEKYLNPILRVSCNDTSKYTNATSAYMKDLSIRRFHTCVTSKYAEDINDMPSKVSDTSGVNSDLNFNDLFFADDTSNREGNNEAKENQIRNDSISHGHRSLRHRTLKDIEKMYPNPKQTLHNIFQSVQNHKKDTKFIFSYKKSSDTAHSWQCTLNISWPEELSFISRALNKNAAHKAVSHKCLHWLEENKMLNKGVPVLFSGKDIDQLKLPTTLSVSDKALNATKMLLDKYEVNVRSIIESHDDTLDLQRNGFQDGAIIDPVGKSNPVNRYEDKLEERNEILRLRYEHQRKSNVNTDLPIMEYCDEIVREVEKNNAVVIIGDTGCGKTTQVPQFIMNSFAKKGRASDCNMIVSQPRRISAVSLAERIADERQEQVGDVVGYQVRLSQDLPNTPAGILFCTAGILLRKLQFNPTLEGCSHVILDEAHERTINTDMLLVLLKRALENRPTLKVIIMSATINAKLFQNYFNCNVIEIPGRVYPVKMNFMEDIDQLDLKSSTRWDTSFVDTENQNSGPTTDIVKMGELISWITRTKPPGAILCFLPGWSEISKMKKYLEDYSFLPRNNTMIVPVHSKMSQLDQRKIFNKPPENVRKIVLATDIAETGITVTDVVYVVDSCIHRQIQWHEKRGYMSIDSSWATQANINQRKGRAGRVQPGESYHFITRNKFEQLPIYPQPEVVRSSLEKTVLDAKTYSNEKALDFLGSMPEPPAARVIAHAIRNLINLGALDQNENLTPLGKRISLFTLNPQLSKALVFSSIFQCVSPLVTITSVMSGEIEIFAGVLQNKTAIRNVKARFHPSSDHVSVAWLFHQWHSIFKENYHRAREFAYKNHIVHEKMFTLTKIRELNAEHLHYSGMNTDLINLDNLATTENEYSELDELCRGVLLAGLDQILYQRNFDFRKGQLKKGLNAFIMEDGSRATITPESINFKRENWPSPFITYARRTHSEERRTSLIRETSIISPLTVFLFTQSRIKSFLNRNSSDQLDNNNNFESQISFELENQKNVRLTCAKETADVLLNLRDVMWNVVRYLVANYGDSKKNNTEELEQVEAFKVQMLHVLSQLLTEASKSIDNAKINNAHENDDDNDS